MRWVKAHARDLKIRPDQVGIAGQSSGGHLAMLAAMRPNDSRYAAAPLPAGSPAVDATVRAVAMSWPVINPLSRYRNAQKLEKGPNPPAFSIGMKEKHDTYWKTEAAMIEGNPMLLLERGEKVTMPPALWVQGRPDIVHDYHDDDFDFPGERARAVRVELPQGGGRHRDRLCPQRRALDERLVRSRSPRFSTSIWVNSCRSRPCPCRIRGKGRTVRSRSTLEQRLGAAALPELCGNLIWTRAISASSSAI